MQFLCDCYDSGLLTLVSRALNSAVFEIKVFAFEDSSVIKS